MTKGNIHFRTEFKKVILSNKSLLILRAGHTQSMICVTLSYFLHCYEKSRRAFIWHSLRESILLSASKMCVMLKLEEVFLNYTFCGHY